jgi:hypothetical protein
MYLIIIFFFNMITGVNKSYVYFFVFGGMFRFMNSFFFFSSFYLNNMYIFIKMYNKYNYSIIYTKI